MKNIRIAIYHCPNSLEYKIVKLTKQVDLNDPCLLWVFDSSKMKMVKKITRNLNLASDLNPILDRPMLA